MTGEPNADELYTHTNLEAAIIQGDSERFHALLPDADLDHRSDNGSTLLHKAAIAGQPDMAAELIERGIELNAQDDGAGTPLHRALERENDEVAMLLIEKGADLDVTDEFGNQPLWHATFKANYELSECLLEHGADPTHENANGKSPLSMVPEAGSDSFAELFAQYTCN